MNSKIRTAAVDYLFDAIMELKSKEECYIFFEDICTINELLSLSQRFEVASMLREKKTYLETSFLMTFVQSGMPPRLSAHDQCMLSHDISACSAT